MNQYYLPQGDTMSRLLNNKLERERLHEEGSRRHSSFQRLGLYTRQLLLAARGCIGG